MKRPQANHWERAAQRRARTDAKVQRVMSRLSFRNAERFSALMTPRTGKHRAQRLPAYAARLMEAA